MANGLSTILLDKHHLTIGETVTLFCHGFTASATDWIGLFYSGDVESMSNCLDYKQGGSTVSKRGLKWLIANTIHFDDAENKCLFKYVNGTSGSVKAVSQVIHIINTELQEMTSPSGTLTSLFSGQLLEFTITGMEARNLKRTLFGRPSPHVKVSLRPGRMQRKAWRSHHGPIGKTSSQANTTEPVWRDEVFAFKASIWDILEVEIRNRHTGIGPTFSRFLGKLNFPLRELLSKGRNRTQTFSGQLMKREPSRKSLGTFSLTIKTNRDLPGSRNSRRQASPDSLECRNGNVLNGATDENPQSDEDRPPSLNASTPDDDLSFRERTSTVPIPPVRAIAQVYMEESTAAQSQPDLLGVPYTTHENVLLRKRNNLSISPELSTQFNSRLSMPPFVFSNASLRSFENSPSTSSSYANDMALRTDNNEDETQVSSREPDDTSLGEQVDVTSNYDIIASHGGDISGASDRLTGTLSDHSDTVVSIPRTSEVERVEHLNADSEGSNETESVLHNQTTSLRLDTILNEVNIDDTNDVGAVASSSEDNSEDILESEQERNSEASKTVLRVEEQITNDEESHTENISSNEIEEILPDSAIDERDTSSRDTTGEVALASHQESDIDILGQQDHSSAPVDGAFSSENTARAQPSPSNEVSTAELPSDEVDTSSSGNNFELLRYEVGVGESSDALQDTIENSELNTMTVDNGNALCVTDTENCSSKTTSRPMQSSSPMDTFNNSPTIGKNNTVVNSAESHSRRLRGDLAENSFMVLESEPDIMNTLSLSNSTNSDLVMPTQSIDIEGSLSRRTVGTYNLRTLFQIPDSEANDRRVDSEVQFAGTVFNEESRTSESSHTTPSASVGESRITNGNAASVLNTGNTDTLETTVSVSNDTTPLVENSSSNATSIRDNGLDGTSTQQNVTARSTVENERTENIAVTASSIPQLSTSDVLLSRRSSLPSPAPSINHVRYLRSKNVSIRLPSRTASPLPVVHVVPPNVPVSLSRTGTSTVGDSTSSPVDAEPVLTATRVLSLSSSGSRTLARDVFDAPDSSREDINDVASASHSNFSISEPGPSTSQFDATTSHAGVSDLEVHAFSSQMNASTSQSDTSTLDIGASHSGASYSDAAVSEGVSRSSAESHSTGKRRSTSDSSNHGKNKKKNKSRGKASRHSSANERTESASGNNQSRRRTSEASRNVDTTALATTAEETNDGESGSSQRPASIYFQISDFASDEDVLDEPLPPHWERAVDTYGRVYYIDHENRITTWIRPSAASASETSLNEVDHHRQNLDRRYQSFRRTLSGRRRRRSYDEAANRSVDVTISTEAPSSTDPLPDTRSDATSPSATTRSSADGPSTRGVSSRDTETTANRSSSDNRLLLNSSFVKFLTRPDLFSFLKASGAAGQYYFSHPEVKNMVKRIKEDPRNYLRFMHDRSLVTFLNGFADTSQPLPRGWEQKTDQYGQTYFVDHNSRSTNFADPRLPDDATSARSRSRATLTTAYADPVRRPPPPGLQRAGASGNSPAFQRGQGQRRSERKSYNQQIVEFMRQPNIDDVLAAKDPSYANNVALKSSVDKIRRDGQRALRLLSDNVDLIVLLSLLEDDIVSWLPESKQQKPASTEKKTTTGKRNANDGHDEMGQGPSSRKNLKPAPYRRDFQAKVKSFHKNIIRKGLGQGPNKIPLIIRREHILEDAFDQLMKQNPKTLQNSKLEVKFSGEEGLDYGGPQREFFFLLSRQLFNPYYGLFEYSAQDTYTLHISAMSSFVDNAHDWYRFSGRIIALVIIHQHLLDAFFTRPFYKLLLKSSCDLRDVEGLDALFHQSLAWIMESDITDVSLDLSFTVNEELGGQVNERELLPGGKDIRVTEDNKLGYVELMSNWRIDRGVSDQRKSILKGFYEIIDYDLVSMFDACELELLISGTADIDINDWCSHTEYRSDVAIYYHIQNEYFDKYCYNPHHKVIRWFWQAVNSFDNERRLRLLQFVTGTSSVPYEGFTALRGSTGLRKFCIERWGNHTMLPRAHTCFNRLDLPAYQSYDELLEKLTLAVEETSTFGIQ